MPLEQVHDRSPGQTGKQRPGVVADDGAPVGLRYSGQAMTGLDGQVSERQHDARKDVDDNLLVDARYPARACPLAEYKVAAQETRHEAVVRPFLAR